MYKLVPSKLRIYPYDKNINRACNSRKDSMLGFFLRQCDKCYDTIITAIPYNVVTAVRENQHITMDLTIHLQAL